MTLLSLQYSHHNEYEHSVSIIQEYHYELNKLNNRLAEFSIFEIVMSTIASSTLSILKNKM